MKIRRTIFGLLVLALSAPSLAERTELSDGTFVDEYGEIHENKYDNDDPNAPWNDFTIRDDPNAPWNDPMMVDDPNAPWNDFTADSRDANRYLRENSVREAEYYWR